jgi:hypothetical protein
MQGYPRSSRGTQDPVNECDLPKQIVLCQPPDLSFADHVHCLVSRDRVQRATDRSKLQSRGDSLLDEAVVLFHDIVHVRRRPATAPRCQFAGLLSSAIALA